MSGLSYGLEGQVIVYTAYISKNTHDPIARAFEKKYGIRVNCLAPETILTEKNEESIPEEMKTTLVEMHPLRRLGTPNDVARAALFLASDDSSWITGQIIDIAGGAVMV